MDLEWGGPLFTLKLAAHTRLTLRNFATIERVSRKWRQEAQQADGEALPKPKAAVEDSPRPAAVRMESFLRKDEGTDEVPNRHSN
jgi:hypothetical protein